MEWGRENMGGENAKEEMGWSKGEADKGKYLRETHSKWKTTGQMETYGRCEGSEGGAETTVKM